MSGRGNTLSGRGNGNGNGRRPRRRNPEAVRQQEGIGPHWTLLRALASEALNETASDGENDLRSAIQDHIEQLRSVPRDIGETDDQLMVRLIAELLDRLGPSYRAAGFQARFAIFWLTDAHWNVETAFFDVLAAEEEGKNPEDREDAGTAESSSESEVSIPGPFEDFPEEFREINRLNPQVDRKPAVKGQETPSKLTITLTLPEQHKSKVKSKTLRFNKFKKGADFDWQSAEHIRELNRWRAQQLRRDLGGVRQGRIYFHPQEREWLTNLYRIGLQESGGQRDQPNYRSMNWDFLTHDFNRYFAGQTLEHGGQPRPYRSKSSILTERYRIPEICAIAGLKPKPAQKAQKAEQQQAKMAEEPEESEGSEESEELGEAQGSGRRRKKKKEKWKEARARRGGGGKSGGKKG